ncbi:MAG: LemA family protein [Candidatus Nealsonbacteria bacterium]|nr:LemA family protein [Candidatus Nealsonbacteria bacterium]
MLPFQLFFLVVVGVLVWLVLTYNRLVALSQRAKEAWSDIEVQLKRRYDLIPNLVETVKGYAAHESGVFEKVTQARAEAMGAKTMTDKAQAENALSQTLKSLFAVAENYPQLQAAQNFLALQNELTDTEDKIQAARRFYNSNVRDLSIAVQTFPSNFVAQVFGFKAPEFFETTSEAEKQPVSVKF